MNERVFNTVYFIHELKTSLTKYNFVYEICTLSTRSKCEEKTHANYIGTALNV